MTAYSLIADIGATNARLALLSASGEMDYVRIFACEHFASIEEMIGAYLGEDRVLALLERKNPEKIGLAVAGPVTREHASLTNYPWAFSIGDVRRRFAVNLLLVVNDLTAVAAAILHLKPNERGSVGAGIPAKFAPIGVLGPGSGLGVSGLIPSGDHWVALSGEGGHVTMAAATARESLVLDRLRAQFGHVSAERVLSGPGLVNIYRSLVEIDGVPASSYSPAQITDRQSSNQEPQCREAVEMFCAMLGTISGNLALTLGARGGIYIAGGIVPKLGPIFSASKFRDRFEDMGRMRPFLSAIPTYVITHPFPALLGLAKLISEDSIVTTITV